MFLEQNKNRLQRKGWIEVICGSMFSGKTEELIRRLKRAKIAKQQVVIFKPKIDRRYDEKQIVSHDASVIQSTPVSSSAEILSLGKNIQVIGIDEAQFFDAQLPEACEYLADNGTRIILAGLDLDFAGNPFGPMPQLLAVAEYITKVHAICMNCGELAHYSYRTVAGEEQIMLGEKESYIPLCRGCYNEKAKK